MERPQREIVKLFYLNFMSKILESGFESIVHAALMPELLRVRTSTLPPLLLRANVSP